ncbi:MAG TPA: MauE/DoxX family redox-associated membrane protein [Lacunisphaera sp.]|nr:MauE/DoxX family redox-associated membrane protein [Lacunisphaera sp.]
MKASTHSTMHHPHDHAHASTRGWRDYVPLIALVAVSALVAAALYRSYGPGMNPIRAMHAFMGFFLVVFALLKLFDLPGFADGFQMYDLLAKHSRGYALLYPFLELALGLAYLAFYRPDLVYLATFLLLGFGALGVINALRKGLDVHCACMGNTLKVPLSTVALVEDLGMAGMALAMWLRLQN